MALEVTGLKHHWLERLIWDDGLLMGGDRISR